MEAVLTNASGRMTLGSSVVRIGSAQDNHVVINDPKVASYHAEIRPEGHGEHNHTIIDLGSRTGTFVNEWLLDPNVPSLLHPHATIRIGDAIFNYEVTGIPQQDEVDQSHPKLALQGRCRLRWVLLHPRSTSIHCRRRVPYALSPQIAHPLIQPLLLQRSQQRCKGGKEP